MSKPLSASDPASLAAAAKCFCATPAQQEALKTYLLDNIALVATNPTCTAPSAPTGVSASNARVADPTTQMNVRWLQPANPGSFITGYVIKWGTVSGVYTNSMNVPLTPHNFTITGLTPGTTYFFVVQAFAFAGCVSANSNEASNSTSSASCVSALITAWVAQVAVNGGAAPSAATQTALCNFANGLVTDGLDTQLVAWNALTGPVGSPGVLLTALTPQKPGPGSTLWGNPTGGFADPNVFLNGVQGFAANNQYITPGFTPSTGFASPTACGWCAYVDIVTTTGFIGGAYNNGTPAFLQAAKHSDGHTYSYIGAITNVVDVNPSPGAGFYSGQRVSGTDHRLYYASTGSPHAQIGVTDAAAFAGPLPNQPEDAWGINNYGVPANQLFTSDTIGFWARTTGLTAADSLKLYNRLVTLYGALGRTVR